MKAYLLYVGDTYYPRRAVGDLVGGFDTIPECKAAAVGREGDWATVVRHADMKRVVEARLARESDIPDSDGDYAVTWRWSE